MSRCRVLAQVKFRTGASCIVKLKGHAFAGEQLRVSDQPVQVYREHDGAISELLNAARISRCGPYVEINGFDQGTSYQLCFQKNGARGVLATVQFTTRYGTEDLYYDKNEKLGARLNNTPPHAHRDALPERAPCVLCRLAL